MKASLNMPRVTLVAVTAVYLVLLALAWTGVALGSSHQGWPAFVREIGVIILVPVPILLALALILRVRGVVLSLLAPIVAFGILFGPQFLPKASPSTAGRGFRVLSFNIGAARQIEQPASVVTAVRTVGADIVCLVEARSDTLSVIGNPLRNQFPYQVGSSNVFILSRFPLSDIDQRVIRTGTHDSLQATVTVDGHRVLLTAVHLRRTDTYPGIRRGVRPLLQAVDGFSTGERDAAVAELVDQLQTRDGPRVLVGDFNMTPTSRAHQVLGAAFQDSFLEAGWALGPTYPTTLRTLGLNVSMPVLRIDYIFHSSELVATSAQVGPYGGSDHFPMIADLSFR